MDGSRRIRENMVKHVLIEHLSFRSFDHQPVIRGRRDGLHLLELDELFAPIEEVSDVRFEQNAIPETGSGGVGLIDHPISGQQLF